VDLEKKRRELSYFDMFCEVYDEIPQGMACVQERPDFVLNSPSGRIGVEVTRYFRPTPPDRRPLQEQFSLQHQIVQRARHEFEKLSGQELSVQIVFRTGVSLNKSDVLPTANGLASALIALSTAKTLNTRIELTNGRRWPNSVLSVDARKCLGSEPSHWRPATAAWVRRILPEDIQQEIFRKAISLGGSVSELLEVWLLIVADGMAFVELSDESKAHSYEAQFNRVVFLDGFSRTCTTFKVQLLDVDGMSSPDVA
jgi:hypothetical protein